MSQHKVLTQLVPFTTLLRSSKDILIPLSTTMSLRRADCFFSLVFTSVCLLDSCQSFFVLTLSISVGFSFLGFHKSELADTVTPPPILPLSYKT